MGARRRWWQHLTTMMLYPNHCYLLSKNYLWDDSCTKSPAEQPSYVVATVRVDVLQPLCATGDSGVAVAVVGLWQRQQHRRMLLDFDDDGGDDVEVAVAAAPGCGDGGVETVELDDGKQVVVQVDV